ncbi:helix-turn-helix domain-containing protein [Flavobacterium fluviatile]|uniref:helix-turn-helix domain-containing protein n=1 Tax=Flavobacterium fluviatile TaxID=1862387 RepID=UPI0013D36793|nr:helix-turn-helix domain-containing protein [Flavobacterium fluviatile]
MIDILLSLFFFLAIIVGFATSFIVLFSKKNYYSKSFFLGLFLFSLAVTSIYNFYLSANTFKHLPSLFTITKSFIFLVAPSAFLYIRNTLFTDQLFKKYDWLHFLPFLIYFGLTIFVWIGNYFELQIINLLSEQIDSPFSMLSLTVWLMYAFCQTMMILNYDLKKFEKNYSYKTKIVGWIRVYNLVLLFLFSTLFLHYFLISQIDEVDFSCYILISSVLIFTVGWLYFKPQVFYDSSDDSIDNSDFIKEEFQTIKATKKSKNIQPVIKELTPEKREEYIVKLNKVFSDKKLYLKKDFVIRDLSDETGISVHHLSNLINSEFNLHFQDFVNLKRIEYFNEKINDPEWKDLSLEGMAWGSGFKSRTTCFRAFIKHTGKSPSEYFKVIRQNPETANYFIQS